jgi:thiol-disulfide isomerase/thioredoxin
MSRKTKNIILVIVVIGIVGAIWYLEAQKPVTGPAQNVVVNYGTSTPDFGLGSTTLGGTAASSTSVLAPALGGSSTSRSTSSQSIAASRASIIAQKSLTYQKAKEFVDPTGFINSAPLSSTPFTLSDFVGKKVVLLDFWTYSCINCQRTIPYLNAWYQKYKNEGLEIIGIHSPEFDFEKNYGNVAAAVKQLGIQYPVVLDSNMGTWNAYQNLYWPEEYLIDIDGFIVDNPIGEGDYAATEQAIQAALKERDQALGLPDTVSGGLVNPSNAVSIDQDQVQSPETYFGSARNEYLGNGQRGTIGVQNLVLPSDTSGSSAALTPNTLYLGGSWDFESQYAENEAPSGGAQGEGAGATQPSATILYNYNAKNVYMVAASADPTNGTVIKVYQDGALVNTLTIKANMLYQLISGSDYGAHTLEIQIESPGLQAYTFTFG